MNFYHYLASKLKPTPSDDELTSLMYRPRTLFLNVDFQSSMLGAAKLYQGDADDRDTAHFKTRMAAWSAGYRETVELLSEQLPTVHSFTAHPAASGPDHALQNKRYGEAARMGHALYPVAYDRKKLTVAFTGTDYNQFADPLVAPETLIQPRNHVIYKSHQDVFESPDVASLYTVLRENRSDMVLIGGLFYPNCVMDTMFRASNRQGERIIVDPAMSADWQFRTPHRGRVAEDSNASTIVTEPGQVYRVALRHAAYQP